MGDTMPLATDIKEGQIAIENPSYMDSDSANGMSYQEGVKIREPSKSYQSTSTSSKSTTDGEEDYVKYGWLSFRPRWLQFLNNPKGYLFFLCWFALVQGMTVNGFIYVITSTLERRFNLPSVQSGTISSCYDFSVMIIIVFVTYLGESSHKPKLLGIGAFIFVLGSITFMMPHFLIPDYNVTPSDIDTCNPFRNATDKCQGGGSSLHNFFWMFVGAQALHGIGASPLFTLGITYLDENVTPSSVSVYVGIFQAMTTLGPAVGYLVGGMFLGIFTDIPKYPPRGITEDHPLWVGAWWLGSVMPACLGILVVIPFFGFPRYLKDYTKVAAERVAENQKGTDFQAKTNSGLKGGIFNFLTAFLTLIKNAPYMFINLGMVTETMILASIAAFGPKFMEAQFNIPPGSSAIIIGSITIPSGLIGAVIGGFLVKKFRLKFPGIIRFCIATLSVSFVLMTGFLFRCPSIKFAGVNTFYNNTSKDYVGPFYLTSSCNSDCVCDSSYNPVCGDNNVIYYSSCHAGCMNESSRNADGVKVYTGCNCIPANQTTNSAVAGGCTDECGSMWGFIIVIFAMSLFTFLPVVPTITATIRCVSHTQRAFALGLQSLLYRALGTVPGPIIFGSILDQSCLLWEPSCEGSQTCRFYNNYTMALKVFIFVACLKLGSCIFYTGCYLTYRPPPCSEEAESDSKDAGGAVKTASDDLGGSQTDTSQNTNI